MRRAPLFVVLALIAVTASGCASAASPGMAAPALEHHRSTPAPYDPPSTPQPWSNEYPAASPYGGVSFDDPGVNPYVDAARDQQSTFALDVDTASYTVARRFIADGNMPDPASVRVEEWVNYFEQGYPAPEDGAFAIYVDGGPTPFLNRDETLVRLGIKAEDVRRRERPAAALTFVIDTSGSMEREDRLGLVKQALGLLVDQLRRDDTVSVVAFGTEARIVLQPTPGSDRERIREAIDSLRPGGSTNAQEGLELGYAMARDQWLEEGINRVMLASDGVANVGLTDAESILGRLRSGAETGIQLVTVGVGMGNYNDALLEQLADQGDGFYAYVDTLDEARRLFVDDLTSTLDTVALDAKVQVEFDPAVVDEYRLIGFENRAVADEDFRNGRVDAGAIGAGHEVTALYALRLRDGPGDGGRIGTVSLRWTDPATNRTQEIAADFGRRDLAARFGSTDEHFKLDALVAAAAEVFRGSPWIGGHRVGDVAAMADELAGELPDTGDVADLLDLLDAAARIDE